MNRPIAFNFGLFQSCLSVDLDPHGKERPVIVKLREAAQHKQNYRSAVDRMTVEQFIEFAAQAAIVAEALKAQAESAISNPKS